MLSCAARRVRRPVRAQMSANGMTLQRAGRCGPIWLMMWLTSWASLWLPSPSWGQEPVAASDGPGEPARSVKVAVLDIVGEGVEQSLARSLTASIKREAARNPAFELVEQEQIDLLDSLLLFGCEEATPECLVQLAESVGAERLIYGRLTESQGMRQVAVHVFHVEEAQVRRTWSRRFSAQVDTATFFAEEMEIFLGGRRPVKPARLRVSSNVRSSAVIVDGELVGRSPLMTERLKPGTYQVEVTREGYTRDVRQVVLVAGEDTLIEVTLKPLAPPQREIEAPPPVASPPAAAPPANDALSEGGVVLSPLGWTLLGAGLATLAAGGVMGALTAQTQSDFDATSLERESSRLKSRGERQAQTANILFGVGGGAVALGVVFLIVDAMGGPQQARLGGQVRVGLQGGGGVFMWESRF